MSNGYLNIHSGTRRQCHGHERSPACSPPATSPTRSIARPSPPPVSAAWRRWMRRSSSTRNTEAALAADPSLRLIRSLEHARRRIGMRCTTAAIPSSGTPSCSDSTTPDACARTGAGHRHIGLWERCAGRRRARLPEDQLARRIRVRPCVGACLCAVRPRLFPEVAGAVPYSPVTGPRLLAPITDARRPAGAMMSRPRQSNCRPLHVNFLPEPRLRAFDDRWLARGDVQYHWHNRRMEGFRPVPAAFATSIARTSARSAPGARAGVTLPRGPRR